MNKPIEQSVRRLAFFTFYEKDGIARQYIFRYLKGLQEVASRIVLIVNGKLTENSCKEIERLDVEILQRENTGLDFAAWNYAIQQLGWEEIRSYDELILSNCSCYGPIYPFSEVWEKMNKEHPAVDFWGLTNHLENKTVLIIPENEKSYVREHIQSYFLVLKKPVLQSEAFSNYWSNFKPCSSFSEEVHEHESEFTEFLSENGFQWSVAYPANSNEWDSAYYNCLKNVQNRLPLIKRKLFSYEPLVWEAFTEGDIPSRVLRYLDSIGYPVGEIYEDLLATQPLSRINRNLCMTHCVSDEVTLTKDQDTPKVALIFFNYYEDLASRYLSYLKNFPDFVDIFVVLRPGQKTGRYQELFAELPNQIEYRIKKENRGRDFAAYMIECRDVFDHYDIVCCTKDKKSPQNGIYVSKTFDEHCWKNIAYSRGYINGVINLFLRNEKLGLVIPPVPDFGPFATLGAECNADEEAFKKLWRKLNLQVPYEDAEIAPFGSMFWIRSKATQTIRSKFWTYADMPIEPLPVDGTLLHSLERMWAYGAQNDGYSTLTCFPLALSNVYYGLSTQHLRDIRCSLYRLYGVHTHRGMIQLLNQAIEYNRSVNSKTQKNSLWKFIFREGLTRILHAICNFVAYPSIFRSDLYLLENKEACAGRNPYIFYLIKGCRFNPNCTKLRLPCDKSFHSGSGLKMRFKHAMCNFYTFPYAFDPVQYFDQNPDLKVAKVNPYRHYLKHGRHEGRLVDMPLLK